MTIASGLVIVLVNVTFFFLIQQLGDYRKFDLKIKRAEYII